MRLEFTNHPDNRTEQRNKQNNHPEYREFAKHSNALSQNYLSIDAKTKLFRPSLFNYWYNSLKNIGFAITPEVEVDLHVEILDVDGESIFNQLYKSVRVSGDTYFVSGSPAEKVNQTLHRTLYDLLEKSFADARPIVIARLGLPVEDET